MKKIFRITLKMLAVAAVATLYFRFDLGNEITGLIRMVAAKLVPLADHIIYS